MARALRVWETTGVVKFRPAAPDGRPQIRIGWRSARHDDCPPFITWDGNRAHTGPIQDSVFIHLNRDASWPPADSSGDSLVATLVHELGHALGLDHTAVTASVMFGAYDPGKLELHATDRAGIHSLYGGGPSGPADVHIHPFDTAGRLRPSTVALRGCVPPARSKFAAVDLDGNGRAEVVAWSLGRNDEDGLMVYEFDARGRLTRTVGPILAVVQPTLPFLFGETTDGQGAILHLLADGTYQAMLFSKDIMPLQAAPAGRPLRLRSGVADLDGDQRLDVATPVLPTVNELSPELAQREPQWQPFATADVDRDQRPDLLVTCRVAASDGSSARAPATYRFRWLLSGDDGLAHDRDFEASRLQIADLNGDGQVEAVVQN